MATLKNTTGSRKSLSGEEVVKLTRRVGLESVEWDGSRLHYNLLDGSAIEISITTDNVGDTKTKVLPALLFTHNKFRPFQTVIKKRTISEHY